MAEVAAIMALVSTGIITVKDPCSFPGCKITPAFQCPSCKATYCPKHASNIDFECAKCYKKLLETQTFYFILDHKRSW